MAPFIKALRVVYCTRFCHMIPMSCNYLSGYSVFSFSTVAPLWSSGKTLVANAGGRGFESHRGHKILFFTCLLY